MLKYSDLTPAQKQHIRNGCGGKGGWINPLDFIFNASCNHHDFLFWLGCSWSELDIDNYLTDGEI